MENIMTDKLNFFENHQVKLFHLFDDKKGKNIIFTTNEDLVCFFGSNYFGSCGLGYSGCVTTPIVIQGLCDKNIEQFFNGYNFVLALSRDKQLFGWGKNDKGQLARELNKPDQLLRPQIVLFFENLKNEIILEVSCGSAHCLALTSNGNVYGWGHNKFGQIGCGKDKGLKISVPIKIESIGEKIISRIYCLYNKSFALTANGLVFSWGHNKYCDLGHELNRNQCVFEPKLINLLNVSSICFSSVDTYFLTNDGSIYMCGQYTEQINGQYQNLYEKLPVNIECDINLENKLISLYYLPIYQRKKSIALVMSDSSTYRIKWKQLIKAEYNELDLFCLKEYLICNKTLDLDRSGPFIELFIECLIEKYDMTSFCTYITKLNIEARFFFYSNIKDELKNKIMLFNVFDDENGFNVLIVTNDDNVYSLGQNKYGCCGLGHNSAVDEPTIVPELCDKNITEFYCGLDFVLCRNQNNQIFSWGRNIWGQLGRGVISGINTPGLIPYFVNENIDQIECGSLHVLALSTDGILYGWGSNERGQVGCGDLAKSVSKPTIIKIDDQIKSIYCSYSRSFALTYTATVYSWGYNKYCELGHQLASLENVFVPNLIRLDNISSVCSSNKNTYFLSNEGFIYFCGQFIDENKCEIFQKLPKILDTELSFTSLHSHDLYKTESSIATAISGEIVYSLKSNLIRNSGHKTIFNFYSIEFGITFGTNGQKVDSNLVNENEKQLGHISKDDYYSDQFEEVNYLGRGAFGEVFKVRKKSDGSFYAVKKIVCQDVKIDNFKNEIVTLAKTSGDFVVSYFDGWVESPNRVFIQMELCSDNLKNILKLKSDSFLKTESYLMSRIEFFICCQLFKEVLECVQYLHESNPPIIHRDLCPRNILLTIKGRNSRFVKLCDFGIATFHGSISKSHSTMKGTFRYMAPELRVGSDSHIQYGTQVDIFSLGVILQDIFGFEVDGFDPNIVCDDYLQSKWKSLLIANKQMITNISNERPLCSEIISGFGDWAVNKNYVTPFVEHAEIIVAMKSCDNRFFYKYYLEKVLSPFE